MHDINYGFSAIEHRCRVLKGDPFVIDDNNRFDLADLLIDIYGTSFIAHPRFQKLMEKNEMQAPHFLTGEQEAKAFENCDYVGLHQSTLRKVDLLANFAVRAHDQNLKVDTTWWEMHGGRLRLVLAWFSNHWIVSMISFNRGSWRHSELLLALMKHARRNACNHACMISAFYRTV